MSLAWLWLLVPASYVLYAVTRTAAMPARTRVLNLANAPFPGVHGQALVYVPAGLDIIEIDVVVYLHGWSNCIDVVSGTERAPCPPGTTARGASDLIGQFERSGRRAVLIVPQLKYDAASGDPGRLGVEGGFAAMLNEIQAAMNLGPVRSVTLYAHSGGYQTAAAVLTHGGVAVQGVALLDALYGNVATFAAFARSGGRFASLYTSSGGTRANNLALAAELGVAPQTELVWTGRPLFMQVPVSHGDVPLSYFQALLGVV